jgi:hypothetical protein
MRANDRFRRDILDRLGTSGPLRLETSRTAAWSVAVVGLTNDNVTQMLEPR